MVRAALLLAAALAWSSGFVGAVRAARLAAANRWLAQGDGVLFWVTWAGDPGSRRLLYASALALALLAAAALARRSRRRALRWLPALTRAAGHPLWAAAGLLLALLPHAAATWLRPVPRGQPSIVFILLDTVRLDHVGWATEGVDHTPRLDELARRGAFFTQAISQAPWTKPSVATLLTGLVPSRHLAVGRLGLNYYPVLPADRRTLAEAFAAAGYDTAAVSANPNVSDLFGFRQGFQRFAFDTRFTARDVLAAGESWLRRRERPFFLYLHCNDSHYPYAAPEGYRGTLDRTGSAKELNAAAEAAFRRGDPVFGQADLDHFRAAYAEEIRYLDASVGDFVERLLSARDDVLVVIVADHGEEFLDHGDLGHGHQLYDELLRVPLQFCWGRSLEGEPWSLRPGGHRAQVRLMDVPPTLLELAGLPWPEAAPELDGASLVPFLRGGTGSRDVQDRPAFAETDSPGSLRSGLAGPLRAWREPGLKLVLTDPWSPAAGRAWLFDLEEDPEEAHNLAAKRRDVALELHSRLEASGWLVRKAPGGRPEPSLPSRHRSALAAMGYVEGTEAPEAGGTPSFAPGAVPWVVLGAGQAPAPAPR